MYDGASLRILHLAHRWLGIGLAAVVLVWTISGLVMLFAERPGLTEEERLEALATLEVAQVRVTPAAAWRQVGANGWPEAVRLNTAFDGRPAYRFLAGGAWYSVHADDASVVPAIGEAQAVSAAAALPGAADAAWQVVGQLAQDYWTRSPRFNSQRPFLLLEDGSGRQAYVPGIRARSSSSRPAGSACSTASAPARTGSGCSPPTSTARCAAR
jgi:hypothetical protein